MAIASCVLIHQPVSAQDAASPPPPPEPATIAGEAKSTPADASDIVVTGSRIANSTFTAPTPVTVVSEQQIKLAALLNASNLQYEIPALIPFIFAQQSNGNPGQATFNLRNLGANRTLVLLNGRRVMPTSYDGTVDGNILPVTLLKRVDVVTGGASAAYGSDAIAGVVNVILDTQFKGLKGGVQYGWAEAGDMKEYNANVAWGTSFADDRLHLTLAAEYYDNSGADQGVGRRPWLNTGVALIQNPYYVAGSNNGQPRQVVFPNTRFSQMTEGGVIYTGPLKGTAFGPGGVPEGFTYGDYVGSLFMVGGSGGSFVKYGSLAPIQNRKTGYGHLEYDVANDTKLFVEMLYVDAKAKSSITPNYDNGGLSINIANPFIPAATRAEMLKRGLTSILIGRENLELGLNQASGRYKYLQATAGAEGKIGSKWKWDTAFIYSDNKYRYDALNNRNQVKWLQAIDVVTNPANGAPICRSTLTSPNNGCVPINLFGPNSISQAGVDYVTGTSFNYYPETAWDASFNVSGSPFSWWAGDVSVAFGGEHRQMKINGTADPFSILRQWRINNVQPLVAKQSVNEGYVEVQAPLLRDLPLVQLLDFDAAARLTKYSTSDKAVWSWKLGLNWEVSDDLRLRATRSRDIRAPTLNDLFQGAGSNVGQITDRLDNSNATITYGTGGNPDLTPEIGNTLTAGVVFTPKFVRGLRASVDYYHITVDDAISSPGIQGIIDNCQLYGQTNLCQYITRSPTTGKITNVLNSPYNAASYVTEGFDGELSYTVPAGNIISGLDGEFSVRAIVTYIMKLSTTNVGRTVESAGAAGTPHWRGTLRGTYSNDKLDLSVQYRYVDKTVYDLTYVEGIDIDENDVGARGYTNFNFAYKILPSVQLYGKVNNVFDVHPPIRTNGVVEPQYNGNGFHDLIGRSYGIGLRFTL